MHRAIASSVVGVLSMAASASASTLLLDFGDATAYDGIDDPAHFEGTVDASYTTWQAISSRDIQTVTDSLGNEILVNLGRNTNGSGEGVDLDRDVAAVGSAGGSELTNNPFASFDPFNEGIRRDPLGVVISGLPVGEYYVYVVAHQSHDTNTDFTVLAGTTTLSGNPGNAGANDIANVYDGTTSDILEGEIGFDSWVLGANYARFTISLTGDSPNLLVAVDGGQGSSRFAYLSGIMITPVPEPASLMLMTAACGLLLPRRRR